MFRNALKTLLSTFFAFIGALLALLLFVIALVALFSSDGEESFDSDIKILPDADGKRSLLSHTAPVLLQINIVGEIGKDSLTAEKIQEMLLASREGKLKEGRVKGVLLYINSPGGGVTDSDAIYRALLDYKQRYSVPLFVYTDGLCASGGYYIACAADRIYSSPVSLVGSVGVLSWPPCVNLSQAMEKLGISALTLTAGKDKDALNPLRPWKEGEEKPLQEIIDFYYRYFLSIVTEHRPRLKAEALQQQYGARVFPAPIALEYGFIDNATSDRASVLKELAQAAGIAPGTAYQVVGFEFFQFWKRLFQSETSPLLTGKFQHCIDLNNNDFQLQARFP